MPELPLDPRSFSLDAVDGLWGPGFFLAADRATLPRVSDDQIKGLDNGRVGLTPSRFIYLYIYNKLGQDVDTDPGMDGWMEELGMDIERGWGGLTERGRSRDDQDGQGIDC